MLGMQIDFEHYLEDSGMFERVIVRIDPQRQGWLFATAVLRSSDVTVAQVEGELLLIWQDYLRYQYLEGHELVSTDRDTTLRFITQIQDGGFHVTGSITIDRALSKDM